MRLTIEKALSWLALPVGETEFLSAIVRILLVRKPDTFFCFQETSDCLRSSGAIPAEALYKPVRHYQFLVKTLDAISVFERVTQVIAGDYTPVRKTA